MTSSVVLFLFIPLQLLFTVTQVIGITNDLGASNIYCRDSWVQNMTYDLFRSFSCSKCFVQVFFDQKGYSMQGIHGEKGPSYVLFKFNSTSQNETYYYPDADAEVTPSRVCRELLTEKECAKWKACCSAAKACCSRTQQQAEQREENLCPATWDGVSCWSATRPSTTAAQECPSYYEAREVTWTSPQAYKVCDRNGSWSTDPKHGREKTQYTECFDIDVNVDILKISLYIELVGHTLSLLSLITAVVLILSVRNLRLELYSRSSLKLHFNLFISSMLMDVFIIGMACVYLDALNNHQQDAIYKQNPPWCKVLHYCSKYFVSTTYMCMFCEGLYLYRRISNVMKVGIHEGLLKYFIISWGIPTVTVTAYAVIGDVLGHSESCWNDHSLHYLEFINIVLYILSVTCNLVFLISIEWMLCTKMRSDTSDRRVAVLRHALRATLSLIPIFGLQLVFIMYRPAYWPPYEIIAAVFTSTQGLLVSVLYCFSTKEVRQELRDLCYDCRQRRRMRRNRKMSLASTSTKVSRMSFPRASIDMLLAKARRLNSKSPANGVVPQQSMCMAPVNKQDNRRDSNNSQGTRTTSFIGGSAGSINSQSVVKVDITPPKSLTRGRSNSSPNGRPNSLPESQRRLVTTAVVTGTDDNSNDCLAPLMYCDKIEADISAVTTEMEMCTGLSPIAEADSSA